MEEINCVEQSEVQCCMDNEVGFGDAFEGSCPSICTEDSTKQEIEFGENATGDCKLPLHKEEIFLDCGTFKNSEELLKAYSSLRAEFTKKSQELSCLRKEIADKVIKGKVDEVQVETAVSNELDASDKNNNASVANLEISNDNVNVTNSESVVFDYLRALALKRQSPRVIGTNTVDIGTNDSAKDMSDAVLRAKNFFSIGK